MLTKEELTDISKGLETLRQSNKSGLRESQVYSLTSFNQIIANINKHFFLIASLLIPFIGALVGLDEINHKLSEVDKMLVLEALILVLSSIFFGFVHMMKDADFYKNWLKNVEIRLKMWSSTTFWPSDVTKAENYVKEYMKIQKKTDKIQKDIQKDSPDWPIKMQGYLLFLALMWIVIIGIRLLYKIS